MLLHEAAARALADHGITHVFGVIRDANLFMMDSFERVAGGHFVSVSNEAGGVLAANGFARTSGRLGVATVTHGPALTNTVTALVESVKDHTPVLLVAGDTAAVDRDNLQNIAQREVILTTGAGFEQVRAPHTVVEDVSVAVRRATVEKRPIVLNVPVEFQWHEVEYTPLPRGHFLPNAPVPTRRSSMTSSAWLPRPGDRWCWQGAARRARRPVTRSCGWLAGSARRWPPRCGPRTCSGGIRTTWGSAGRCPTRRRSTSSAAATASSPSVPV